MDTGVVMQYPASQVRWLTALLWRVRGWDSAVVSSHVRGYGMPRLEVTYENGQSGVDQKV